MPQLTAYTLWATLKRHCRHETTLSDWIFCNPAQLDDKLQRTDK